MDISEKIYFRDVCVILDKIKSAPNAAAKEKYLRRWYNSFQKLRHEFRQSNNLSANEAEDGKTSFYCILRCLIPGADIARPAYGMQISTLGREYIKILQLNTTSIDANRLRANSYSGVGGDYADIVYSVLKSRCRKDGSNLKLKEVHDMLDVIATEDRRTTEKILTLLFDVASAQEQMWFIRLLLKSMRLGIGEQRIFGILHDQAKDLYQRCSNLERVCCLLADNNFTLFPNETEDVKQNFNLNIAIKPFEHIRPMLCELFPGNVEKLLESDVMYLETKMDGERFQLHYYEGKFKYISRKGIDYTASFGQDYKSGNLTPHLTDLLPIGMQSMIIDGEMMIWDEQQQRYREKSENTDVKHLSGNSSWRPCFVLYDLLYFNGTSLLDMPYIQRTIKLSELFREKLGVLRIMTPKKVNSIEEFREMFQNALDNNEEGVVVKKQSALYRPGVRHGGGWYKIKADYIDGLTTEFDLLIIGGFYNRTRTFVESFLLGVLKYISPLQFEVFSIGKVKNITSRRVVLNDTLKPYWHQLNSEPPPMWYHYVTSTPEGRPDVWIEPKNSEILQVKATDLNPSSVFYLKRSLHFPRIQSWRNDKVWNECMSLNEYNEMIESSNKILKINKRELRIEDLTSEQKRIKISPAQKRQMAIESYGQRYNPSEVRPISELLEGFSFCILSASIKEGHTPEALKTLIVSHGGEIVENPILRDTHCLSVAGDKTFRVKSMIKTRRYNIVSLEWLLRITRLSKMSLKPDDMISMTDELREEFETVANAKDNDQSENEDEIDNASTQIMNVDDEHHNLITTSEKANDSEAVTSTSNQSLQSMQDADMVFEDILWARLKMPNPNIFRDSNAVFFGEELYIKSARIVFELRGGNCIDLDDDTVEPAKIDFIFYNLSFMACIVKFKMWLHKHFSNQLDTIKIVHIDWVIDSYNSGTKLNFVDYLHVAMDE